MKKLIVAFLVLIALVAGALFWLHGNLDGIVRHAIVEYGSEMIKAKVSVGGVKINAVDGQGTITDLVIGNPQGFKSDYAFKVKQFTLAIDPASLAGNVVTIKQIAIIAPDVIYEKGESTTNFDVIQKNIADYVGLSNSQSSSGKKLIVEKLVISDAKAQASAAFMAGKTVEVSLPNLTLHNLGKSKGGITSGELGQEITGALKNQLTGAINFNKLGKAIGEVAGGVAKSTKDVADKALGKVKGLF